MRKSFDGPCGLISSGMQFQATSGEVCVEKEQQQEETRQKIEYTRKRANHK